MRRSYRQRRILGLLLLLMVLFSFMACRLFYLQIVRGSDFSRAAVRQRSPGFVLEPGRGDILDREGISLLDNREKNVYVAFPSLYRAEEQVLRENISSSLLLERLLESSPHSRDPFVVKTIPPEQELKLPVETLPGIVPAQLEVRYGPGAVATHVVGHLEGSSGRGIKGIEKYFDKELSGDRPTRLMAVVDGRNRLIEGLGYRLNRSGGRSVPRNVILTLDYSLQNKVESIMTEKIEKGAVVVVEPGSGDLLALASRPDYDRSRILDYLDSSRGEFHNRALRAFYPGSIFKTVVAAAALEEGKAGIFDIFECVGEIEVEGRDTPVSCMQLHSRGEITFKEAFSYSCNTVFIKKGLKLGAEKIEYYARSLGMGETAGLPLGEHPGYLPAREDTVVEAGMAHASIGQEHVETTPLQIAQMMQAVANEGRLKPIQLVKQIENEKGITTRQFLQGEGKQVLSPSTAYYLKLMLQGVVDDGTGTEAAVTGTETGGKTGTAQYSSSQQAEYLHWFAGMTPLKHPGAVIVVFIEESREGASAAEVFSEVARAFQELE